MPYPLLGMGSLTYIEEGSLQCAWRIDEQLEIHIGIASYTPFRNQVYNVIVTQLL